jgi:hypothetical protein
MTRRRDRVRERLRTVRTIAVCAAMATALCIAGQSASALAQENPQTGVWAAPVGHRQPTRADLPPDMRRDEGAVTPRERSFDNSLNICRGC